MILGHLRHSFVRALLRWQQEGDPLRRALALIMALAMLANGCASIRVVDPARPGRILLELNQAAEGKSVRVELLSGLRLSGTGIYAASDSTTWFDPGDRRVVVSTAQIAKVDVVGRGSGNRAGLGALIGSVPGCIMLVGALIEGPSDSGLEVVFVPVTILGGALLGGALGLVFEVEKETTTTYMLNEQSAGFHLDQ